MKIVLVKLFKPLLKINFNGQKGWCQYKNIIIIQNALKSKIDTLAGVSRETVKRSKKYVLY